MGRISTGIGLVSGIPTKDIIDQLMALEERPKQVLETRIESANQQRLAYTDLSTRLTSLKLAGTKLKKPSTFENATTSTSNEDVITATAAAGAATGSFRLQVARLVTSQQTVSRGFTDFDATPVGAGTITVEQGGGELSSQTPLSQLHGGAGVRRGLFRITDRAGQAAIIDITSAVTLDDVVKKINTSLDVSVRASLAGDKIKLTDLTGQTTAALAVTDLADGHAAEDLGLTTDTDVDANTITGGDVNYLTRLTALSQLNDGRGVRAAASGADFTVQVADGTTLSVTLGAGVRTVGDVLDVLNAVDPTRLKAEVLAGSNAITLTDLSTGGGGMTVTAIGGSKAAQDLGLLATPAGATLTGDPVLAGLGTVLISSLNGGQGLTLGNISITDRSGTPKTINLASARTVQDVLDAINNDPDVDVVAKLKSSGNGIQIVDESGGTGNLIIDNGATATALGLNGTFGTSVASVQGKNLQRKWVSENTLLKDYNGGKGVPAGKFKIANSNGVEATIDLTQGDETTLGHVIAEINAKNIGVTASINANGDGLLLTDTAGGALKMKVDEVEGSAAASLNIKGEAAATTIDGSFEQTVAIDADDTLSDVQAKLNDLGFGVTASIINDGTGLSPYRLSLSARQSGRAGRVCFDAGATGLNTSNLVESQDAAVFLGDSAAERPLLITASQNQLTGVIKGVTIDLHGVSDQPVTLGVARTVDTAAQELQTFTDSFNEMVDKLRELTKFDTEKKERGLLLGELAAQRVESEMYAMIGGVVEGSGRYRILADVGVRVADGGKLEFNEEKFRAAFADDPDAVQALFTAADTVLEGGKEKLVGRGIGYRIEERVAKLIDPVSGVITRENKTIDDRAQQFQQRIDAIDKLLASKRTRLERQFAQMESIISNLQNQQQAIGQIQPIQPRTSTK